jgi:hypothetical protein
VLFCTGDRADAAAEMARQEQQMDSYNNAKRAQGDQREAQRLANCEAADRYNLKVLLIAGLYPHKSASALQC